MVRLTSLAAILTTVLLLVANTYAIRTTIPMVENIAEVTNPHQTLPRCREQILGGFYPLSCMFYITRSRTQIAYEPMCCMEMRFLDDECHCEALEQLLVDLKQRAGKLVDMEDAEERAQNIPVYCNLKERCRIHIITVGGIEIDVASLLPRSPSPSIFLALLIVLCTALTVIGCVLVSALDIASKTPEAETTASSTPNPIWFSVIE
ncbi:hypothetical protein LWI28_014851 [Acer negundo]|uniref:Bifunctional inhibitor/plant lipid transfer protein/seed storage helical domain-containing protein n=1 Tax=Acer negundo TaxID=4023 RepID=A0AAD5J4U5_ACENE|nr:hypothetical protein LWI28_014851 [Acer negundo]